MFTAFTGPRTPRRGQANPLYLLAGVSLVLLVILIYLLPDEGPPPVLNDAPANRDRPVGSLFLYCAAAMRKPIAEIADRYAAEFGVRIQIQYGGSNTLLNQIAVARVGDLFLSADERYLELARDRGLVGEIVPLARMEAVIGVARGNPLGINTIDDLTRPDVRVALANPDQAAIGSVTRDVLRTSGHWQSLADAVRQRGVFKPTVGDVAGDVALGSTDAGILWDAVANQYAEIEIVPVPELADGVAHIGVALLTTSRHADAAEHFCRYLAATDRGLRSFKMFGFPTVNGEKWNDTAKEE